MIQKSALFLGLSITSLLACLPVFGDTEIQPMDAVEHEAVLKEERAELPRARPVFPEYEKLVYRAKWLGIPAGELVAEIKGLEDFRGRKAYRIEVSARTTGICSLIYRIDDHYVSYLDAEEFHTLRHEVHRREGHYKKDAVTDFDQNAHKAYFKSLTDGSEKVYDVPPNVQDTVTASYYSRFLPLGPNRIFTLRVANSEQNYALYLRVHAFERRTFAGKVREVFKFQPYARQNGRRIREGRVSGYISADSVREPLLVVIKAPVFTSIAAWLVKVERRP